MRFLRSRWFLFLFVLIGAGALWRYVIADWLAERRLREYEREAKARGLRWTLAEYKPAAVPPEDDAALLPVFASTSDYEALLKQVPHFERVRPRKEGGLRPIDWKATRASLSKVGLPDDVTEPDDFRALDAAMRGLQPLIDQLRDSKATSGNWGDSVWKADLDSPFGHTNTAIKCIGVLHFRARLDLALGKPAEARRSIEALLRLSQVFNKLPVLITHLIAVTAERVSRETICEGMKIRAWDDEALRAFGIYFRDSDELAKFQWAMATERAWSRDAGDAFENDPEKMFQMTYFLRPPRSKIDEWLVRFKITRPAFRIENQLWYERAQDELATMIDAKAGVWRPIERAYDPTKLTETQREQDLVMVAQSMNSMYAFSRNAVWAHAQNKMAAIACYLDLARRASGKYPDNLDALAPAYFPRLPLDPANGESFQYRVQPDGTYRLYSVGFDRKDQGGETSKESDRNCDDPDWPWLGPGSQTAPK